MKCILLYVFNNLITFCKVHSKITFFQSDQVGEERKSSVPPCTIFMPDYLNEDGLVKTEDLESMVFDRLVLTDHEDRTQVRHMGRDMSSMSSYEKPQHHPFHYLHNCYERIISEV